MQWLLYLLLSLFSCSKAPESKPLVLVSVAPYISLVEAIAGDSVEIRSTVPAGFDPHLFEPTHKQMDSLAGAKLYFSIGESFEETMLPSLKQHSKDLKVIDLAKGLNLIRGCHSYDTHIWLSFDMLMGQVDAMTKALSKLNPSMDKDYLKRSLELKMQIQEAKVYALKKLQPLEGSSIVVLHPALGYFCREFHLKQIALEHEGKQPLPRDLADELNRLKQEHVQCIIAQTNLDQRALQTVAKTLDLPLKTFDIFKPNLIENLKHLADLIHD